MKIYNFILSLTSVIIISACTGGGKSGLRPGNIATITEKCISASDEDSFDEMTKLCNRKDEMGLELMEQKGKIQILYTGTKCTVIKTGFSKSKLRLKDGTEVWVANEFVK